MSKRQIILARKIVQAFVIFPFLTFFTPEDILLNVMSTPKEIKSGEIIKLSDYKRRRKTGMLRSVYIPSRTDLSPKRFRLERRLIHPKGQISEYLIDGDTRVMRVYSRKVR